MRRAFGAVAAAGVVLSIGAGVFVGPKFGASALAGALVALGNLWVLARAVRNLLSGGGNKTPWALMAVAKFFVLLGVTFVLVKSQLISPLGLAAGFGALPLGILFSGTGGAPGSAGPRHAEESDHA
jgi:hypothetical protein